ncbi:MAG TPA: DUF1688 family protein [Polyangiaceae bacterium]|nr:DUF1688 family protein [Polyangiaceae bacterium]
MNSFSSSASAPGSLGLPNTDPEWLCRPSAVRQTAHALYAAVEQGQSQHFRLGLSALSGVLERVEAITRTQYPQLDQVPYHSRFRHFNVGSVDRLGRFEARIAELEPAAQARARFDLVISSVLLDAGAGPQWSYTEANSPTSSTADATANSNRRWTRSEGLAVASYDWFMAGGLSSDPAQPLAVHATRLETLGTTDLAHAFQVNENNPLVGLEGRAQLLRRLGERVRAVPESFGKSTRPGGLADVLLARAVRRQLPATEVLSQVLDALGPVWPSRPVIGGRALGDVWPHSRFGPIPFHKLSQWLTYSLCEALELSGVQVLELNELTGLAEYRNGGLFVDAGVIVPLHDAVLTQSHAVGSDLVIEWRALTIALLDLTAEALRARWGMSASELPLAKVLEAGTWAAGRQLAAERRSDSSPPIRIESDGTVF